MPEYLADLVRAKYPGAYDDMSDADLESAIKAKHPGAYDDIPTRSLPTRPVSAEDFAGPQAKPEGSALGRFASGVWEQVNPVNIVKGIAGAVEHPLDTGKALLGAQLEQFSKAKEAAGEGNYNEAAGRTLAGVLPLLGPAAAKAGEKIGSGDIAGGLGTGVGLVAPAALGAVTPKVVLGRAGAVAPEIAYAEKAGIPLDVATATDNKFLRAAQHVADRSLAGSFIAENAQKTQAARMASVADELAAQAHPSAVTPLQAGEAAQRGVGNVVTGQRLLANDAYDRLRAVESAAGTPPSVDLAPVKTALQPIADRLAAKKAVTGVLMGTEGTAAARIAAILDAPDAVPLSVADSALSDIKSLARTNHPDLRTVGQGLAAKAVSELHTAVSKGAADLGPDAVSALNEGRIATKAKYAAADVLNTLEGANRSKSGATAYRGLTQAGDTSIGNLKATIAQAPETKPLIARAVLDGVLNHPTAGAAKTWSDWQKLGLETKVALFAPEHVQAIDNFLALRKRMANNPNPSGTGHTILTASQGGQLLLNPAVGVPAQLTAAAVTKLMHSPTGVRLLTRGMQIPVQNVASRTAWLSDLAAATSPSGSQPATAGAR